METVYFLGIDISKKKFDVALTIDGKNFHLQQVENTAKAIQLFLTDLRKQFAFRFSQLIVCVEHTGIYCHPLLQVLVKNQIKVCLEPALRIKQSQGMTRGKSDQVDAKRIALYAFRNRESLLYWQPQRQCIQVLKALLGTRERLVKVKTQLQVPLAECPEFIDTNVLKEMARHCKNSLKAIEKDIDQIEQAIDKLVKSDSKVLAQFTFATSVTGIGKLTALNMIVSTDEFTRIKEPKKFACYAGVAPFEHTSGSSIRGKTRISKLANMTLKRLLHLAAMSAIQHCDEIRAFYNRKVGAGKNKMSVINAVRNKLIKRVFVCINEGRMYQKIYQNPIA